MSNPLLLEVSPGFQTRIILGKIQPVEADRTRNTQPFYLDEKPLFRMYEFQLGCSAIPP